MKLRTQTQVVWLYKLRNKMPQSWQKMSLDISPIPLFPKFIIRFLALFHSNIFIYRKKTCT